MKKLNKVLCLGAFAAASVMPLSGCNLFSQNLSEEQIDKLMYALDNADSFMDESLDLLEKSNEKLNNEEAYNLVRLARKYLYLNKDGVRDNLKVTIDRTEQGERSVGTVSIYTDSNNEVG